jgi:hypothetical protein
MAISCFYADRLTFSLYLFLRWVLNPGHEADHSPPSSVEVKNVCVELYLQSLTHFHGVLLN